MKSRPLRHLTKSGQTASMVNAGGAAVEVIDTPANAGPKSVFIANKFVTRYASSGVVQSIPGH